MYKKIVIAVATLMTPILIATTSANQLSAQMQNAPIVYVSKEQD